MARMIWASLALLVVLAIGFGLSARSANAPETVLFHNGVIRTAASPETADALYMRDGVIIAVGDLESVQAQAPRGVRRFDLEGGALTPGLIEPHTHPLATGLLGQAINLSGPHDGGRAEVMALIEQGLARGGPSPWAIAFGWDPVLLGDVDAPSRTELDALSPDRPLVVLTQMLHEAFANSAALEAAGIHAGTPDPEHGYFERDASGALTGRVVEVDAVSQLMAGVPTPSDAALEFILADAYARYAQAGYTTIGITGLVGRARDPLAILSDVASHPRAPLNTVLYLLPEQTGTGYGVFEGAAHDTITRVAGLKLWLDGSPFVGGAATETPYADSRFNAEVLGLPPGWRGPLALAPETALAQALDTQAAGHQLAFHVQGERAIDLALDVIETAQRALPHPDLHHRLEHLALATPEQIERAASLGVSMGFFPDHIGYYGHRLEAMFGPDRAGRYMPIHAALESGAVVTIHGDHPASTIDAARVMALPVMRQTPEGDRLGERIAAEDAFAMMTLNAARQLGLHDDTGSLEVGKRADLVWFDRDPVAALDAGETFTARQTWIAGRPVDQRGWSLDRLGRLFKAAWGQMTR
ncbi:amidohydrolase [Oceanicaulis sp. LC35]|uniref:amidohydrolase n=1 Tax=Oceanicaulis sp. LC35 TaxID=3349635 RepID=UPI003F87F5E3